MNKKAAHMLAFIPHPIDAELGIGGTVAHLTREGKDVVFVLATSGETGSSDPEMKPEKLATGSKIQGIF